MNIHELLSSVLSTYAAASTYSDRGHVRFVGGAMDGASAVFTTRFERQGPIFSLQYSDDGEVISLEATGGHVEIAPSYLRKVAGPCTLADAVSVLTGVTSGVAYFAISMLLPDVVPGPSPCAQHREFRLKERPASPLGPWVLETVAGAHDVIRIGPDFLVRGFSREVVTGTTEVVIDFDHVIVATD